MFSNKKEASKGMTRGKFLSFLGKIGLLSLITGTTSFAQVRGEKGDYIIEKPAEDADIEMPVKLRALNFLLESLAGSAKVDSSL